MDAENESSSNSKPVKEYLGHTEGISSLKRRKRKGRKKQFCRPTKTPFNADIFTEFVLKLDRLKNLDWRDPTKPAQYVIRASCMGKVYGHFLSGQADMTAYVTMSRSPHMYNSKDGCPDIDVSETIVFHVPFKELLDNPVVLTLLDGRLPCKTGKEEDFAQLKPLGYMCLDMLELVNNEMGFIDEYIEPWVLPLDKKVEKLQWGIPLLQFFVSCTGGLPEPLQLRNGNSISIFVESMHRLPEEILQVEKQKTEMNIYVTLPISYSEPYLVFPRGQVLDENHPNHKSNHHKHKHHEKEKEKDVISKAPKYAHWASVLDHWPEIPKHAANIPGDNKERFSGELSGDMLTSIDDNWKNELDSTDTAGAGIVWDCLHRTYIPSETYQKMLQEMSKNSTWPLEVAVTINKEISKPSGERKNAAERNPSQTGQKKLTAVSTSGKDYSKKLSEGNHPVGSASAENRVETIIVYHGIAFFDLTQLLSPGRTTVRFASRLYPYREKLLLQKTTIHQSAFLSSIPGYLQLSTEESVVPGASNLSLKHSTHSTKKSPEAVGGSKIALGKDKSGGAHVNKSQTHHGHHGLHGKGLPVETKLSNELIEDLTTPDSDISEFKIETMPFIIFEITMDRPIVPLHKKEDAAKIAKEYSDNTDIRALPRRRIVNARMAQAKYRRSVLQASAELCDEFHNNYLEEVVNDPRNSAMMDQYNPASSCDALKKGFLFYLNATGRYVILREHLRNSISHIIQQRCLNLRPHGFQSVQDFQSYLHDMYIYLVDQMHDILSKTQMTEVDPFISLSRLEERRKQEKDPSKVLQTLCNYAEEALAQGDFDNCHRIHLERICKSEEDPNAWVDFSIMWLARGDDRMAEIAIREALRLDPEHVHALLIGGLIAAKHEDERAVDCIGTALGLAPTSPECMVLLAMVYKIFNNDVAADYYFKYARYMHRMLTGGDISDMGKEYNKLDTELDGFDGTANQNYEELIKSKEQEAFLHKSENNYKLHPGLTSMNSNVVKTAIQNDPRIHKVKRNSRSKIDSQHLKVHSRELKRVPSVEHTSGGDGSSGNKHHHKKHSGQHSPPSNKHEHADFEEIPVAATKDIPFVRRDSISGKPKPKKNSFVLPHILRPNFQFDTEFTEDAMNKMLPQIVPSIQTPWDVTQLVLQVSSPKKPIPSPSPEKQISPILKTEGRDVNMNSEEMETPKAVHYEHDVIKTLTPESEKPIRSFEYNPSEFSLQFDEIFGENYELDLEGYSHSHSHDAHDAHTHDAHTHDAHAHDAHAHEHQHEHPGEFIPGEEMEAKLESPSVLLHEEHKTSEPNFLFSASQQNIGEYGRKKYTTRSGSEYIWTAQLLLQLRLFDFMDGVLAREIHLNEKRNVQYLYLRAMSLYLRQRSSEALSYINEALDLDSTNSSLWALKGHCYYRLKRPIEAIESYEKSLILPHDNSNQHLVYLRFGSLCLDHGGEDESLQLAKKIFRRGVYVYPSPYMWLAFGNTCYQLKLYEEAENAFAEANRMDNTSPLIWGHLALVSLARGNQALAEQSYKWAIRFGLKKGPMIEEIKRLQKEKGFGDPSFPRVPNCIPHDFYLRRVGKQLPFDMYKEALFNEPPQRGHKYYDTERETELKRRLEGNKLDDLSVTIPLTEENKQKDADVEDMEKSERQTSQSQLRHKTKDKKKPPANKKHEDGKDGSKKEKRKSLHGIKPKDTEK